VPAGPSRPSLGLLVGLKTLRLRQPLALSAVLLLAQHARAAPEDAAPRTACVAVDTCTLVRPVSAADGVESVVLVERPAPRPEPTQPFAGWMAWPHAPAKLRAQAAHGASVRIERPTEAGTFLLRAVPSVRVAEEPDALLVLLTFDPLRPGIPPALPEPVAIALEHGLLDKEQASRAAQETQAQRKRSKALTDAWAAFNRAPADHAVRTRFLDAVGDDGAVLDAQAFLTPEQRTALRRAGLALDGRIVLEDGAAPGVAYRLRVEAVPLEEVARSWNAGLRALVNPLERVPRPVLLVLPGHRYEEVSFALDVKEGEENRMSQVVRRLLAVPGLATDGKELAAPAL
jgi:hypothetical protein